jgi:diguanylate cyclase (GGDEF)-like protein
MSDLFNETRRFLSDVWSNTDFARPEISDYAQDRTLHDTRQGLITLSWVLCVILSASALLYSVLGLESIYIYSSVLLAALALHIAISARLIADTRVLYLMAITLLVINGVAMVLMAHKTGAFNSALFASVVFLFLVMPLVPWGMREALLIVLLVYGVFTLSTLSVQGRFDSGTLWSLQFVMLGASLTTLIVIARNAMIRKDDIKTRYELEAAHDRMQILSLKDPLTGAWNRRFLEQNFNRIVAENVGRDRPAYLAVIDVNDFKQINDRFGHDHGDLVLKQLVRHFMQAFTGNEHVIRMGGDEFAVILFGKTPHRLLHRVAEELRTDPELFSASSESQVHLSMGAIRIPLDRTIDLNEMYTAADQVMYQAKRNKSRGDGQSSIVVTNLE